MDGIKIDQLSDTPSHSATTYIPIVTGNSATTKKISANNLLSKCAKINMANTFDGNQYVTGNLYVSEDVVVSAGLYANTETHFGGENSLSGDTTIGRVLPQEIARLSGVTSNIQTQLDTKLQSPTIIRNTGSSGPNGNKFNAIINDPGSTDIDLNLSNTAVGTIVIIKNLGVASVDIFTGGTGFIDGADVDYTTGTAYKLSGLTASITLLKIGPANWVII